MHVAAFKRFQRIVRATALVIGIMTAVAVPSGFGVVAYLDEVGRRKFQAGLAADRIAQYAYVQGRVWKFAENRLSEMIAFVVPPNDQARQRVSDAEGTELTTVGDEPQHPLLRTSVPIVVADAVIGHVTIEASLWPLMWLVGLRTLIGFTLGASVYACVNFWPLRALRRVIDSLSVAQESLRTQIVETEEALEKAQRERQRAEAASHTKSQFLANISHELRTPLNAIIDFSELMRDQAFGKLSDRYHAYAVDINASGTHLLKLINDVLDISKIDSGRMEMHFSDVVVDDLLAECVNLVSDAAREGKVSLVLDAAAARPHTLVADRVKMKQILLNLLSNAVKFTPAGGAVTLSVKSTEPAWIDIEVTDTGIGMTKEHMTQAIHPFEQADNSHSRKYQGTGLGLPIVLGLVKLHGGMFRLSSEPERGTTATIRLPVESRSRQQGDASWAIENQTAAN